MSLSVTRQVNLSPIGDFGDMNSSTQRESARGTGRHTRASGAFGQHQRGTPLGRGAVGERERTVLMSNDSKVTIRILVRAGGPFVKRSV